MPSAERGAGSASDTLAAGRLRNRVGRRDRNRHGPPRREAARSPENAETAYNAAHPTANTATFFLARRSVTVSPEITASDGSAATRAAKRGARRGDHHRHADQRSRAESSRISADTSSATRVWTTTPAVAARRSVCRRAPGQRSCCPKTHYVAGVEWVRNDGHVRSALTVTIRWWSLTSWLGRWNRGVGDRVGRRLTRARMASAAKAISRGPNKHPALTVHRPAMVNCWSVSRNSTDPIAGCGRIRNSRQRNREPRPRHLPIPRRDS